MFGEKIKKQREAMKLSQTELAKELQVTKQTISSWENHSGKMPSVDTLIRISKFFHCSIDYLVMNEDNREFIEVQNITDHQLTHIKHIIQDMEKLNLALKQLDQ